MQLRALFPGVAVAPVRGNVLTRLRKLDEGQFSALVLAAAGLKRLGLEERITRYFTVEELLPAAGQGILALQTRAGESCPAWTAYWTPTEPTAPGPSVPLSAPWTGAAPLPPRPTPGWRAIP